ncbi:hypothetical protein ACFVYP_20310 [Kitasatospora sp. NPDC058201]|uniref:hypothetical protein n=1 Tax=Streptomycetaceae TaxID=2062 RepID=UPI002E7A8256|nr:hypothetical protein [Streptomyces sp. BE303]MED7949102.1 hypothetical protein [Streptomyces sp. BE303]
MRDQGMPVKRETIRFSRLPIVLALSASALLSAVGPARAADIPDYQAALDLVKSADVRDAVCRFLGTPLPQGGSDTVVTIPDTASPCEGLPAFTLKDPLAVNEITPGFAAGTAPPLPTEAIRLSHLVSSLNATVNDRTATVLLAPTEGGGWHLAGVRDGDSDATYAGKAGLGTLVFTEPQIRGWYQLKLTTVEPLNDQAREGLDGQSAVSLADYQKLLKARYADKLPGSEYDTRGLSSGYGTTDRAADPSSRTPLLAGGSIAALALVGGAVVLGRIRRRNRDTA